MGMVLQRDSEVNIWGWAASNEEISVHFIDSTYTTRANSGGEWCVALSGLKSGGPYSLQVKASNIVTVQWCHGWRCLGVFGAVQYGIVDEKCKSDLWNRNSKLRKPKYSAFLRTAVRTTSTRLRKTFPRVFGNRRLLKTFSTSLQSPIFLVKRCMTNTKSLLDWSIRA